MGRAGDAESGYLKVKIKLHLSIILNLSRQLPKMAYFLTSLAIPLSKGESAAPFALCPSFYCLLFHLLYLLIA
jgi:hypothetical protein